MACTIMKKDPGAIPKTWESLFAVPKAHPVIYRHYGIINAKEPLKRVNSILQIGPLNIDANFCEK